MSKRAILIIALLGAVVCFLGLLLYPLWLGGGSTQLALPADLVPTAAVLLDNPLPTPAFVGYIAPRPGTSISAPIEESICISVLTAGLSTTGDPGQTWAANNTQVWLNGQRLPRENVRVSLLAILERLTDGRTSERFDLCISPALERGLHLIELRTSPDPLGILGIGTTYSYQWAYRVE